MTILSVVVPVYRVMDYLVQCLDSILADAPAGVEVIAVDDCSPDECGLMLDEYAAKDDRVRVLHLAHNVGLGEARNAGLAEATGTYVWFVDSDDWLPPGSVAAVLERLDVTRPDVLLLDHLRVYDDGGIERDLSSPLLGQGTADSVVTLSERPSLLRVQHTAWNRVVRRAFLDEIGLRFFPGWYEDFPFSHPVLIAAARIAVLDRVCYYYRQRRSGAITKTPSPRHFEVFDQYERLFDLLATWGAGPGEQADDPVARRVAALRPMLFSRMIDHYLVILGNDDRVPANLRRAFFRRMIEHYRRYLPEAGYPPPGGADGLKHRLVRTRAYPVYLGLRWAYRVAGGRRGRRARADTLSG